MHVNTLVITVHNIFLRDLFVILTDIIINTPQQCLYSKKVWYFSTASCSTDKTKPMDIINACKHNSYYYL